MNSGHFLLLAGEINNARINAARSVCLGKHLEAKILKTTFRKIFRRPDGADSLKQLRLLAEQGSLLDLEKKAQELLSRNSHEEDAMELLAYSLQQQGRLEEAAGVATRASERFPGRWLSQFLAGVTLKGLGREKEAIPCLKKALAISPNDRQTLRHLTEALATSEGIDLAAQEYAGHCRLIGESVDIAVARISTVRDWAQEIGLPLLEAGEVEEIPFRSPHVFGDPAPNDIQFALSNKPYVAEVKDARIFSNSSLVLTADGVALSDTGGHPEFGRYVSFAYESMVVAQQHDQLLLNFSDFKTRTIDAGILLSGLASNAFGHWLPEFLPKLQFFKQHSEFHDLPIIVDRNMPQSHFDHLRRLATNPLILLEDKESLRCKRLFVAPTPAFSPVEMLPNDIPASALPGLSPRALRYLRAGHSDKTAIAGQRRIFLARKNMKWRRLINEEDIAADLFKLGFEKVFIEDLAAPEQIELFQQARWIVAPNGSALLNLIFADTSAKLLVLAQPKLFNWGTFQGPMDDLGYQTLFVCGDQAVAEDQKHSDYHIPAQRIREALSYLGMSEA